MGIQAGERGTVLSPQHYAISFLKATAISHGTVPPGASSPSPPAECSLLQDQQAGTQRPRGLGEDWKVVSQSLQASL